MEAWMVATTIIFLYLVFVLLLGWLAHRKLTVDIEDFFLYGRKAGFVILYFSVVSTYFSAFAFLGSAGFFYTHGIGFWDAGSWTIVAGIITYVIGPRIWGIGKRFGYITPADMLADFYESEFLRVLTAIVSVTFTIFYIQGQALGLGYILSVATGDRVSIPFATGIMLLVAVSYVIMGGIRAVFWTDVIQGIWMYIAVWVGALFLCYKLFDGPIGLSRELIANRPDLLTLPGPNGYYTYPMWFGLMIILSFGTLLQPQMLVRHFTAVSGKTIKWIGATLPLYLTTFYLPAALVGLGGALVMPGIEIPDRIFPEMLFAYAPAWLTGIILAGATAAAMSTLDSILHVNMSVLTRDIYQRYVHPEGTDAHYILVSRIVALALLVTGYILSVINPGFIVLLVVLSSAGTLQLWPALIGNLFPSRFRFSAVGIIAGMIAGLLALYYTSLVNPDPLTLPGGIWAIGTNLIVAAVVSHFTRKPSPETVNRIHSVIEELAYPA